MTSGTELVERLRAWLIKRSGPDAGIDFEASTFSWDTLRRNRQSRTTVYGTDAEFVAEHFHGSGAAAMLAAIERLCAERDEAIAAAYDQPHGPSSRILWSTRYGEVLDDAKEAQAALSAANAEVERLREALATSNRHLDFVARWAWREGARLTDAERLSVIKYYPPIKALADLSARAALSREA